ncbi:hypothetical protein SAMN05216327_108294 [Dyadobacter sp. SG02]|uniref:hypothetical protein n=1 Tax=Dyadobacter sp. SG02 TaxID=1855291 RepID=UPI0008C63FAB|nr:hypothetical protein [Dyadobacter sp. SG02]SEJ32734.1 hypothetical protein SAMN05216327_108294 [Dyadobacter sp. SG02]
MKRFVTRTTIFAGLVTLLLAVALFIFPNPAAKHNMLGALLDKHDNLRKTAVSASGSQRIIIIGGSNVAYGLDSKRIQDALQIPVINAGLHASLGMKFYLTDIKPYIRQGDILVVIPEYSQYYTDSFYGNMELVSVLFDVYPEGMRQIDTKQWCHLLRFIPFYAATKFKISKEPGATGTVGVYDRKAFNAYGDAYVHWTKAGIKFKAAQKAKEEDHVNPEAVQLLVDFQQYVEGKKATMFLMPPAYQSASFANQKPVIDKIHEAVEEKHLPLIAAPERYKLPDSVFFDTNYHLLLPGIERRSKLMIEDIARVLPEIKAQPFNTKK